MNTPPANSSRLPKVVVVLLWAITFAAAPLAVLLLFATFLQFFLGSSDLHPLLRTYIAILFAPFLVFVWLRGAALWREGFRWLPKPQARRLYWGTAIAFISLLVLCYSAEAWRGRRAYAKFMREVESRGVRLDLQQVIPPPVRDEENFCATPLLAAMTVHVPTWAFGVRDTRASDPAIEERLRAFNLFEDSYPTSHRYSWTRAEFIDLAKWRDRFAANSNAPAAVQAESPTAAVLLALQRYDSDWNELRSANLRPHARWLARYEDGWLGVNTLVFRHKTLWNFVCALDLQAAAELRLNRSDAALEDVKLALRLADTLQPEPSESSHRLRLDLIISTLQPVWEGLAARCWSEAQLADLQTRLEQFDLGADWRRAVRGEQILYLDFFQRMKTMASLDTIFWHHETLSPKARFFWGVLWAFIPSGWYYDDMAFIGRIYEHTLARPSPFDVLPSSTKEEEVRHTVPVGPISRTWVVPRAREMSSYTAGFFASANLAIQQARLACALERYRLAQPEFPESLSALVPRFIEKLPTTGTNQKPLLGYRRTTGGSFILFPADMPDASDVWKRDQSQTRYHFVMRQGDGVWRYPTTSAPE